MHVTHKCLAHQAILRRSTAADLSTQREPHGHRVRGYYCCCNGFNLCVAQEESLSGLAGNVALCADCSCDRLILLNGPVNAVAVLGLQCKMVVPKRLKAARLNLRLSHDLAEGVLGSADHRSKAGCVRSQPLVIEAWGRLAPSLQVHCPHS